ncbi:hypothetical protein AA0X95_20155 [Bacillus sp. 1P10SD]|uniref:hypothetical protein n=1 Tax=Bacillus sp. 1P10SD TaxID=3132265 RepID=UPI0039A4F57C
MQPVLRPKEPYVYVEKKSVNGECPECKSTDIKAYPVLSEGGWWKVEKCQSCLCSIKREKWGLFGSIKTLTESI